MKAISKEDFNMNQPENTEFLIPLIEQRGYSSGIEIGVRRGEFSSYLCYKIPKLKMIAVDAWAQIGEMVETYPHEENYQKAIQNFAPFQDRISVIRAPFNIAAAKIPNDSVDFIFIDGTHTAEAVARDIADFGPKVRKGGIIAGHDYHVHWDDGKLKKYLDALNGLSVDEYTCWWIEKK